MRFQRIRERLALALIVLLPFHAFAVTVLTRVLVGPGHAPLTVLALWKEVAVLALLGLAFVELVTDSTALDRLRTIDPIDRLISLFAILAVVITGTHFGGWGPLLYGAKYDILPLLLVSVLSLVPWSPSFGRRALSLLIGTGTAVALLGFVALALPQHVFTALGYSDLHSLYVANGPLAPYQQIGGSLLRRMQSVMSGPNQLGIWFLLPLSAAFVAFVRHAATKVDLRRMLLLFVLVVGLTLTFSRSAWLAAAVLVVCGARWMLPAQHARRIVLVLGSCVAVFTVAVFIVRPAVVLRAASSRGHFEKPLHALQIIGQNPFGLGLGTAGPASNRFSDTCVELEAGADVAWAQPHPELCVFVAGAQVQPTGRPCNCPLLPESWYLQIGVETGVFGLLLFLSLLVIIGQSLLRIRETSPLALPTALMLVSVCVAGLFLHAWEDSAVAYTLWILVAAALSSRKSPQTA